MITRPTTARRWVALFLVVGLVAVMVTLGVLQAIVFALGTIMMIFGYVN